MALKTSSLNPGINQSASNSENSDTDDSQKLEISEDESDLSIEENYPKLRQRNFVNVSDLNNIDEDDSENEEYLEFDNGYKYIPECAKRINYKNKNIPECAKRITSKIKNIPEFANRINNKNESQPTSEFRKERNEREYKEVHAGFGITSNSVKYNEQFHYDKKGNLTKADRNITISQRSTYCKTNFLYIVLIIIIAFLFGIGSYIIFSPNNQPAGFIENLKKDFPLQPSSTFDDIETIINDVLKSKPIHPAVFLFLYKENTNHNLFIQSVAKYCSNKLNILEKHIVVEEVDYKDPEVLKDYGKLIFKYVSQLTSRRVMVIKDIHKMTGKVAQALHVFCDEYSPLVDRVVYIMTLKVDTYEGKEMHLAEEILNKYWSDLEEDKRAPLIVRVTSSVFKIY